MNSRIVNLFLHKTYTKINVNIFNSPSNILINMGCSVKNIDSFNKPLKTFMLHVVRILFFFFFIYYTLMVTFINFFNFFCSLHNM
jgi:hypothetical protein